jgi:hypothetical protein
MNAGMAHPFSNQITDSHQKLRALSSSDSVSVWE